MALSRKSLSALGLGRALYYAWHAPRAELATTLREGSINRFLALVGKYEMQKWAARLSPLPPQADNVPCVYFLSGDKFWYQTLFCAYSLARQLRYPIGFAIVDDGSLSTKNAETLSRILVGCRIISRQDVEQQLE